MSEYTAALLNSRILTRASRPEDSGFERGEGTRAATHAYKRQAASLAAAHVVTQAAKRRPTSEERRKDVERRRTWAGGGNMPPGVRARYSEAERAALSVIAEECKRKGQCSLCLDEIGRLAGVSRTSVQNAIRKARSKENGHISVRERPQERGKSLTNIIKVVCQSWLGWIARAIGFKRLNTSETAVKNSLSKQSSKAGFALEREGAATQSSETNRQLMASSDQRTYSTRNEDNYGATYNHASTHRHASIADFSRGRLRR